MQCVAASLNDRKIALPDWKPGDADASKSLNPWRPAI
jgi:hypothetical protein